MKNQINRGISFIEILIVISIITIVSIIIIPSFSEFRQQQVLKNTSEDLISLINEARNNTIASRNSSTYGIHLQSDKAILFEGLSFNVSSSSNKEIIFDATVSIPLTGGINLTGGGSDIVFTRITGDTSQDGTIVIEINNNPTKEKIITINKIGVASLN